MTALRATTTGRSWLDVSRLWIAIAASCIILAGCSRGGDVGAGSGASDPSTPGASGGSRPNSIPDSIADVSYPLDSYDLNGASLNTVRKARYVLMQQCMADFGFTLPPDSVVTPPSHQGDRYGVSSDSDARQYGYGTPGGGSSGAIENSITDAAMAAVFFGTPSGSAGGNAAGVPEGGCFGSANRALTEGNPEPEAGANLVQTLRNQAFVDAGKSQSVVRASAGWSACMNSAGYDYADPVADPAMYWEARRVEYIKSLPADVQRHGYIAPPENEVSAALADVACKRTSGWLEEYILTEIDIQQRLIDKNAEALSAYKDYTDEYVRRAQQALQGR